MFYNTYYEIIYHLFNIILNGCFLVFSKIKEHENYMVIYDLNIEYKLIY